MKVREKYVDWDNWNICPFIYKQLEKLDSDASYQLQPFLYPLSCLTETIIHNGVEEIPLVELAKIDGFLCEGDEYVVRDNKICVGNSSFTYLANSFFHNGNPNQRGSEYLPILNQLLLFDYLYSRRINIWGIDAIDPNELGDNNPYI
jgi:hypothetical protein